MGLALSGAGGSDLVVSGAVADTISGGAGNDQPSGGGGDDTFSYEDGFCNDTGIGGVAGETSGDLLDLSAPTGPVTVTYADSEAGTAIRTPAGDVRIEGLRVGNLVCTLDGGPQPIRWIGRREAGRMELAARPKLCPILIPRGVLAARRNLPVSPCTASFSTATIWSGRNCF